MNIDDLEKEINANFEKEIRAKRKTDPGWAKDYKTPIEKSKKAAEYLISHASKPIDFDWFHKKFDITMDKGGMVFAYDTLNWHTRLWLEKVRFDYKLFCIEKEYGEDLEGKRYILVDKKEKIDFANDREREKRVFSNEFKKYMGAYYNSKFEIQHNREKMTNSIYYLLREMCLSKKEAKNASKFIEKHKKCTTESRSVANVKYTITFSETSAGSFVKIQCEKCHKEEDISDEDRSNW